MQKITKAVIPCGGMGTRFLPITKAVPKEILPVIDTPVLGHIVGEAIDSGITDILIVLGNGKESIREYFTPNPALEQKLRDKGNHTYADILAKIAHGARISFEVQKKPLGSGDALLYAESFACGQPFALAWGDDLIYAPQKPVMAQLMAAYDSLGGYILGVQTVEGDGILKYGVADIGGQKPTFDGRAYPCYGIKEKPKTIQELPSRLAALGRYIMLPTIFDAIRATPSDPRTGELQLTDSLNALAKTDKVFCYDFEGKRYDMGDKFGSVCAIVDYAARDEAFGAAFRAFIKEYAKTV